MPLFEPSSSLFGRAELAPRQSVKFDAIGFAANVVELTYLRLERTLWAADPNLPAFHETTLADAWAIVDWIHRLDGIVRNCPGLRADSPGVVDFLNGSSLVETPRHRIQHLASTFEQVTPAGRQPWGYLTWTRRERAGGAFGRVTTLGRLGTHGESTFVLRINPPPRHNIDYVSLFASDDKSEIGITGQYEGLVRFGRGLEASVAGATATNARGILLIPPWNPSDY